MGHTTQRLKIVRMTFSTSELSAWRARIRLGVCVPLWWAAAMVTAVMTGCHGGKRQASTKNVCQSDREAWCSARVPAGRCATGRRRARQRSGGLAGAATRCGRRRATGGEGVAELQGARTKEKVNE